MQLMTLQRSGWRCHQPHLPARGAGPLQERPRGVRPAPHRSNHAGHDRRAPRPQSPHHSPGPPRHHLHRLRRTDGSAETGPARWRPVAPQARGVARPGFWAPASGRSTGLIFDLNRPVETPNSSLPNSQPIDRKTPRQRQLSLLFPLLKACNLLLPFGFHNPGRLGACLRTVIGTIFALTVLGWHA